MPTESTLTARWLVPVAGPPLEGGTLTIGPNGRIADVSPHGRRTADIDLGDTALLPGFVNAHTHLDLSGMRGLLPPSSDFTGWLRGVIAHRRSFDASRIEGDIRAGLAESLQFGTTLLGDISAGGASWDVLAAAPISGVVYHEILGLPRDRALAALAAARDWLLARPDREDLRPGWSPHAPYSVARLVFENAASYGRFGRLPLAVHLAETRDELRLLATHDGPFADFLREVGVWEPGGLVADIGEVLRELADAGTVTLAHGNYLPPDAPVPPNATVVYCPRTHAAFGHDPHPLRALLARGVRVALGTDSLASNPDLSVLAEARFVRQCFPDLPPSDIVRLATRAGAEALGFAADTGSLERGKWADLAAVALPASCDDPTAGLLDGTGAVTAVWWHGRRVAG